MAKKVTTVLMEADPRTLRKHIRSLEIYGEKADEGFDESIARRGVDEPIVVAADKITIISGVKRRNGAIKAGHKKVPILVRLDLTDDLDIREAIIEANRHNEQTAEVRARAYQELKRIEQERAKRRLKTSTGGFKPRPVPNLAQAGKGKSRDKAAEKAGMKHSTAEKASEVVDEIDAAEAAGDTQKAAELRETLNNKSVSAAHKQASKSKYQEAFDSLPEAIRNAIDNNPKLASDKAVIALSKKSSEEQQAIARQVRVGQKNTFDAALGLKSSPKKSTKKPSKPPKKYDRKYWLRQYDQSIGPLVRLVDKIAKEVGESKSASHKLVQNRLNQASEKMVEWMGK